MAKSATALFFFFLGFAAFCAQAQASLNIQTARQVQERIGKLDTFSFAVFGDSRGNPEKLREILTLASSHDPAFMIHTGDFTTFGSKRQYRQAVEVLRECPVPVLVLPGNHDLMLSKKRFGEFFGPHDFYLPTDSGVFIFIDTNDLSIDNGRFAAFDGAGPDLDLSGVLALPGDLFIAAHHPPGLPPIAFRNSEKITPRFSEVLFEHRQRIQAVVAGHLHGYATASPYGVPVIIAGGAGAPLNHKRWNGFEGRYNYVLVHVRPGCVTHEVVYVD